MSIPKNFFTCGIAGWCFEVLFTGMGNLLHHDKACKSHTSILMFPIYGLAALIQPISHLMKKRSMIFRGGIYTLLIFTTEYLTGIFLKNRDMCPWDYSKSRYNVKGVIRLDYVPVWFSVGLFYEKLLNRER